MDIEVTILNWNDYQTRKDLQKTHWFRLENSMWMDSQFFTFTPEERWVWVCLMSYASQKMSGQISFHLEWFAMQAGVKSEVVESTIEKLRRNGCVSSTLRARDADDTSTTRACHATEQNRTEQNNRAKKKRPSAGESAPHLSPCEIISRSGEVGRIGEFEIKSGLRSPPGARTVIAAYIDAFRERYGPETKPPITGKTQGLIKSLLKTIPEGRLCLLVQAYLQMNDDWFKTKLHDFETFNANLNKVAVALDTGTDKPKERGRKIEWDLSEEKSSG